MRKYLLAAFVLFMTFGVATLAGAQDSPRRDEVGAKVQGRAGDTNFDVRVQGEKGEQAQRSPQGREGERGDQVLKDLPGHPVRKALQVLRAHRAGQPSVWIPGLQCSWV